MGISICILRLFLHSTPPQPSKMSDAFPEIKSKHSLVAKHVTKPIWDKLSRAQTKTSGFTLEKAIACAVQFDNQHCGIYAGDWDSYKVFSDVFDPIIQDYHGISPSAVHTSDMDASKITRNVDPSAPVHSTRIRVGRSIDGFGLSPRNHSGAACWSGGADEESLLQPEGRFVRHLLPSEHHAGDHQEAARGR